MEHHHANQWINPLFLWAIFNSKLLNYQRVIVFSMYLGTLTFLETKKSNLNGFGFNIVRVEMFATCLYLHGTIDS